MDDDNKALQLLIGKPSEKEIKVGPEDNSGDALALAGEELYEAINSGNKKEIANVIADIVRYLKDE